MSLSSIDEAVEQLRAGKPVIVVDDEDRENEGDLILAAELAAEETVAFMIRYTSGIICVSCEESRLQALELPQMVPQNTDPNRTAFTISVDHVSGLTTGISAKERANTIKALADTKVQASGFVSPGHVFPLRYKAGGVLVRSGHTEAAIDLCKLAGLRPAGALAELNHDDGSMMRLPALKKFAEEHDLPIISIESLIKHRAHHEVLVQAISDQTIQLLGYQWKAQVYRTEFDEKNITVLIKGEIDGSKPTLVRIVRGLQHRDFFSSALVSGNVINRTLHMIAEAEQGVFIYLPPHEASELFLDEGVSFEQASTGESSPVWREVGIGSHILSSLGVERIHLVASKELTFPGITSFDLSVETIIKEV